MIRFLIIDGHAILHRAYHALPSLTTSKGEQVNAVYGFISMLLRVTTEFKPTHLVVAFDLPIPTFRKKMYAGYQATRPEMEEGLSCQIPTVHRVLGEMNIAESSKAGYEADDVIGTMVKQVKSEKLQVKSQQCEIIIVTGDRDLLQLVDKNVSVFMPVKGLANGKLFSEKDVMELLGVTPSQVIDYKGLVGDSSDNYPGVAGIGPKTATGLLSRFGTLEGVYKHLADIESEKVRKSLETHREDAILSKKLATIDTNVPDVVDRSSCKLTDFNTEDVQLLFDELEFRSLIPRLSLRSNNLSKKQEVNSSDKSNVKEKNNTEQQVLF